MILSLQNKGIVLLCLGLFLVACSPKEAENSQAAAPEISVVQATGMSLPVVHEFVGQIYGHSDIAIRARVDGYLEGRYFDEGSLVKRNKLLYSIEEDQLAAKVTEAQSKLVQSQTNLVKAKANYDRVKPLSEINAVSKSDLDEATASLGTAEAAVEASEAGVRYAKIELGYTKIYSPITGVIGRTEARVGDYVGREPNPVVLTTVSKIDTVRVQFYLTESQFLGLNRYADEIRERSDELGVYFELVLSDGSLHTEHGYFEFIDRNMDANTGTIMVQLLFANPKSVLRPGQFANVRFTAETGEKRLVIPQRCVIERQGNYNVFVINQQGEVAFREVKLGSTYGNLWRVRSGLEEGEQVVYEAIQRVRTGMRVEPKLKEIELITE